MDLQQGANTLAMWNAILRTDLVNYRELKGRTTS